MEGAAVVSFEGAGAGGEGVVQGDFCPALPRAPCRPRPRRASEAPAATLPSLPATLTAARRLLLDSVLCRAAHSQAAAVRRRAVHQLTCGADSAPFLALVGVSLASGSGIVTKADEVEQLCFEMRQAVGRTCMLRREGEEERSWTIQDFELGGPIGQGCNAVVYSARLRREEVVEEDKSALNTKEEVVGTASDTSFPLAIKMMFNYHAESNAFAILRAMRREVVPARAVSLPGEHLEHLLGEDAVRLRAHPNIVEMVTVFADQVPSVPGAAARYGTALPRRLHAEGLGRNMSLFLVMRAYDTSLAAFLEEQGGEVPARTSLVLLTQLLEAVAFLGASGVAHRDLKADNLLVNLSGGPMFPHLVLTDFGACLASAGAGLRLPFPSLDTDRGGNMALMAPEVVRARPGAFATIDYSRADLWTAGTIAHQLYGQPNPFTSGLSSRTYVAPPPPPPSAPPPVRRLLAWVLAPRPSARPPPRLAATIAHLLVWAPGGWVRGEAADTQAILQWLLTMTTKVVCESRWGNTAGAQFEYTLAATFLATLNLGQVREALAWIQEEGGEDG